MEMPAMSELCIEEWDHSHPRWEELLRVVADAEQADWVAAQYAWHRSTHMLVAQTNGAICGFLRFVTQDIGADADCEPVMFNGTALIEAKVLAFGVLEEYRRQGIGRALQAYALRYATHLECYQVRSHSSGGNRANHHLKLSMGFGVHPILRGDDRRGVYFVMPLRRMENHQHDDE
jgi:GNAT superfamily N-acetyltransferase